MTRPFPNVEQPPPPSDRPNHVSTSHCCTIRSMSSYRDVNGDEWYDTPAPWADKTAEDIIHESKQRQWRNLDTSDADAIRRILQQPEPWRRIEDVAVSASPLSQGIVDTLQSVLDNTSAEDTNYQARCKKCLLEFANRLKILPSRLIKSYNAFDLVYRPGTAVVKRHSRFGESLDEHYRGSIPGHPLPICVTRRVPETFSSVNLRPAALIWSQLQHENILPLYAFSTIFREECCFITPWMSRGNVFDFLYKNPSHERLGWVRDVAVAIKYLHNLDPCITHEALSCNNILVRDDLRCYLSGFWQGSLLSETAGSKRARDILLFGHAVIEMYAAGREDLNEPAQTGQHIAQLRRHVPVALHKVVNLCVGPESDRPEARIIVEALYDIDRGYLMRYEARNSAAIQAHDIIQARQTLAEYCMPTSAPKELPGPDWIATNCRHPILDGTASAALRERFDEAEPWNGIERMIHDHRLPVQSVIDQLQQELDKVTAEDSEHQQKCVKCLRVLSQKHDILPSQLYIRKASFGPPFNTTRLGGGGFSDIYQASIEGELVCVKSLRVHQTGGHSVEHMKKALCHEALIWRQAAHENILPFYGVSDDIVPDGLCFISPWMKHGNVREYLHAHPEHDCREWVWNVAAAMQYLHSLAPRIIHKDIRGANILLDDDLRAYLSDFGISLVVETHCPGTSARRAGNVRWLPPELIDTVPSDNKNMEKWDIYSFGCTIIEMYTRENPYAELRTDGAVVKHISQKKPHPQPPPHVLPTSLWRSVVAPCLSWEPYDRPSADDILDILESVEDSFINRYLSPKWRAASVRYHTRAAIIELGMFCSSGPFADISRATMIIEGRVRSVCLKRLRVHPSLKTSEELEVKEKFIREAFMWGKLDHENILPFYGVMEEVMPSYSFCLISPWMAGGNLVQFLETYPSHDRLRIVWDIASGIKYLHKFSPCIVHNGIRAANILVGPEPHYRCCITHFSNSLVAHPKVKEPEILLHASPIPWIAPEMMTAPSDYQHDLLWRTDIYSFGCTIIEIYTGRSPYADRSEADIINGAHSDALVLQPPDVLSPELWTTIVRPCLSRSPTERPSAADILDALLKLDSPSLKQYLEIIKLGPTIRESALDTVDEDMEE
ncbi:kinase-like protein [Hymenopellis radicata]|nr:kinase-like protein [Hymenopellis radicata]